MGSFRFGAGLKMVIASQIGRLAADSYPPTGLSAGVEALPEWIQKGCGATEYICAERGATFSADYPPSKLPDLSEHNSFFAETMRANPGLWEQYKGKKTSLGVGFGHCIKTGLRAGAM